MDMVSSCPSSPAKRRVLAALDPNASAAAYPPKQQLGKPPSHNFMPPNFRTAPSEVDMENIGKKRALQQMTPVHVEAGEPATKRPCLDEETYAEPSGGGKQSSPRCCSPSSDRTRSASPRSDDNDTYSIFDTSGMDNSQVTTLTEPDLAGPLSVVALPAARLARPRTLTREEAREKAEILRLRLGLAHYKVRTGQTDVPLERLQLRPLPISLPASSSSSSSSSCNNNTIIDSGPLQRVAAAAWREALAQQHAQQQQQQAQLAQHLEQQEQHQQMMLRRSSDTIVDEERLREFETTDEEDRDDDDDDDDHGNEEEEGLDGEMLNHTNARRRRRNREDEIDGLPRLTTWHTGSRATTPRQQNAVDADGGEQLAGNLLGGAASGLLSLSRS
ncbi:hypothetical protein B0H63DRAFT_526675 [Podospora didyma]|uniref:Uncharacterized protein n=1 Tax=Podospora didyma TaxID=330526 RepID=A0AAE0KFA5_9PEZI|nr:hypothetical protein B0H63DRAFT_526675 [Podospora didyma]